MFFPFYISDKGEVGCEDRLVRRPAAQPGDLKVAQAERRLRQRNKVNLKKNGRIKILFVGRK